MKKFFTSLLAGMIIMASVSHAKAVTINYLVDFGSGFGNPVSVISGLSTLEYVPGGGTLNVSTGNTAVDVGDIFLGTDGLSGPGDAISDLGRTVTIRFIDGANTVDVTQTIDMSLNHIFAGSASIVTANSTAPTPASFILGGRTYNVAFESLDVPGSPVDVFGLGPTGREFEGKGAKTDLINATVVPEPSSLAILMGTAAPLALFWRRFRR